MVRLLWLARFFIAVPVVAPSIVLSLGAAALAGIAGLATNIVPAERGIRIVEPILLLQLFATSSGFMVPARRGHYDLLFTSGANRVVIGLVHWLMCASPGVLSWLSVALAARYYGSNAATTPDVLLALIVASTVPWALTIPLTRLAGAILCLAAVSAGFTVRVLPAPALVAACIAAVAAGLFWIRRMDAPLEPGQ